MSDQQILMQLVHEVEILKAEQRRQAVQNILFEVLNQNTASDVTADQNNYALGDYDLVFLNPTAARAINGITGGVKGRMLLIVNTGVAGAFNLTFNHQSASATTTNRIVTPTAGAIAISARHAALFTYTNDLTITPSGAGRWYMLFPFS